MKDKEEIKVVLVVWAIACLVGGMILMHDLIISNARLAAILFPALIIVNISTLFVGRLAIIKVVRYFNKTKPNQNNIS